MIEWIAEQIAEKLGFIAEFFIENWHWVIIGGVVLWIYLSR